MPGLTINTTLKLSSGNAIPALGFGVYQARGVECENAVKEAIKAGYRHIDSAQAYHNEDIVGKAVKASGLPRSSFFLTTKYMSSRTARSSSEVLSALRQSLKKIDMISPEGEKYIDLMLIHAPFGGEKGRAANWEALRSAQEEGWIRDIGVSNFGVAHLKALPSPTPAMNQIEIHPWCQQKEIAAYCKAHDIHLEAYCPLARADPKRLGDKALVGLTKKYNKEPAQVLVRWSLQKGYAPLPKSVTPSRIHSNADLYDFELSKEDMAVLDGLDLGADGAVSWNPVNDP
ncbi:hypothetical protein P7C73_g5275, partial [Tremellales sp. Uapishka_1]